MKKSLGIVSIIAWLITVLVSYLSNSGLLNGETMGSISAKYQNLFTPAGYAFSIWGIIYLGLLGFVIYHSPTTKISEAKETVNTKVGWWFVLSCIANSLWVIAWLYQHLFLSVVLMTFLFVTLLKIAFALSEIKPNATEKLNTNLFAKWPFYIYAGWVSVALIANIAAYLKELQWQGFGIAETYWAVLMIVIASIIHLLVLWKRKMPAFSLVAVWTLIAIAFANQSVNSTVVYSASAFAILIFANIAFSAYKRFSEK